jgi:predicted ATPase/DNA-binding CsgD family transcriptional regulator/Tfp pilus assembly protein PilF
MASVETPRGRGTRSVDDSGTVLLRVAAGGLLGREDEIAALDGALAVSRLVTLTGAPGIGKTRLALAVAARHRDPVAVTELAPSADPGSVPAAVAAALSIQEMPGQSLIETIVATYRSRRLLLVLDNCEHVLDACSEMVGELLAGCPELRVLATSREPLGLQNERGWSVPPLSVPPRGEREPEALIAYPAVALFVRRAGAVQPGFALNPFLAADVAEICRRLDGIPLAIELAAGRVGMLTPSEIARRLEDRLLSDGGSSPLARHRTLAAALDWSHALLRAPERVLLRRLSVFAGRFEAEAVQAICSGAEVDPPGVSHLLGRLASKSLLAAETGSRGQVRYRLLETIRAYAAEKLEQSGEVGELRTAHAQFYLVLAERAEPELTGARQALWLERLEAERANLRAAIEWLLCCGQPEPALRLAGALVLFWRVRSHFSEGRELLDSALSASAGAPTVLRAKAFWGTGFLTLMAGNVSGAIAPLEESLAYAREVGDCQGAARALLILANVRQLHDDLSASALLDESARLAREAGDHWCQAHALGLAGMEYGRHDDLPRARPKFEECLAVARGAGDMQGLRFGLIGLGELAMNQGDYAEAQLLLDEAVQVTSALGEDYDTATAVAYLGDLALRRGEYDCARALLDEALALLPEVGPVDERPTWLLLLARVAHAQGERDRARCLLNQARALGSSAQLLQAFGELAVDDGDPGEGRRLFEQARERARAERKKASVANALHALGQLARAEGDPERSAALHDEALELRRQVGEPRGIAESLEAIAGLAVDAGHHVHSARLFGAATALRARGGYARASRESARYAADTALVSRSLPAEELIDAIAAGESLSLEDALAAASEGPRRMRHANGRRSLTKREREVVELVAEGLTNPEIAQRLVISLQTVKRHVSHVFAKLGVTARSELALELRSRSSGSR